MDRIENAHFFINYLLMRSRAGVAREQAIAEYQQLQKGITSKDDDHTKVQKNPSANQADSDPP